MASEETRLAYSAFDCQSLNAGAREKNLRLRLCNQKSKTNFSCVCLSYSNCLQAVAGRRAVCQDTKHSGVFNKHFTDDWTDGEHLINTGNSGVAPSYLKYPWSDRSTPRGWHAHRLPCSASRPHSCPPAPLLCVLLNRTSILGELNIDFTLRMESTYHVWIKNREWGENAGRTVSTFYNRQHRTWFL